VRYPRSFLQLLLAAFTLVALPLVIALITSAIAVDRIAERSQTAVYQAVQATQSSRRLSELLTTMERSARQIVILNDRSLLETYNISRALFEDTATQLAGLMLDEEQLAQLATIVKTERQIFDALSNPALNQTALQGPVSRYAELSNLAQIIAGKSAELIDREVDAMRSAAIETQRIMLWQGLTLIPVIILLVIGFALLIARPIRQIEAAIRNLGDGKLNVPIAVNGPADLEYLGARLEWTRRQLLDIAQQKNRFLQQISHELKTPLSALREGAQLLSDDVVGKLTPEQREIAEIIRHSSIELQLRIEELLDYGSLQFHKLKLELAPVNPRQALERVLQSQKLALQTKNLVVQTQLVDGTLQGDRAKIGVVLDNLLSNAIKFSPPGGTIAVSMHNDGKNFMLDVNDEGPGIAEADRARIFEPFYQGRTVGSGAIKGSGLGLSIVKEYVVAHGGSVEALAAIDARGAHFRVRLPVQQPVAS